MGGPQSADLPLTERLATYLARSYYNRRGEYAGTYSISRIGGSRLEVDGPEAATLHLRYVYTRIDRNDTLHDHRTFRLERSGTEWAVTRMGEEGSGRP